MPLKEALDIGRQVADGLEAAHEKGVVHRDIKPPNVMVDAKGRATIMDLGLARLTEASRLTKADQTMGTVAYMSPEQAQGMEVDKRSDIWALGVVLYEMVAGARPFRGEYDQALLYEIVHEEPEPLTGVRAGVPMELEFIVGKCLAKDPAGRYQSAGDAIVDLRTCAEKLKSGRSAILRTGVVGPARVPVATAGPNSEPPKLGSEALTPPGPVPSKVRLRIWKALAGTFLVSTAVLACLYFAGQSVPPKPITFTIDPPEGVIFESGEYAPPVFSPDGTKLAFVGLTEDGKSLWIRPLDSLDAQRLPGTDGAEFPFWSPDNRCLAFFADGKLKKIDITGGPPQILCDAPNGRVGGGRSGIRRYYFQPYDHLVVASRVLRWGRVHAGYPCFRCEWFGSPPSPVLAGRPFSLHPARGARGDRILRLSGRPQHSGFKDTGERDEATTAGLESSIVRATHGIASARLSCLRARRHAFCTAV